MTAPSYPEVAENVVTNAAERTLVALTDPETPSLLASFYDPETNYAGATFATLAPQEPDFITATDLLAVTALAVDIPARAIRRFLDDRETARDLATRLRVLPEKKLENATEADFIVMGEFYETIKSLLSRAGVETSNPWVTASKLTARKRPGLFPVRDRVVCSYLGIIHLNNYAKDWFVFRALLRDSRIVGELNDLPERVYKSSGSRTVVLDEEPLRLLDAVLWRFGNR